jgi:hypothetical protein
MASIPYTRGAVRYAKTNRLPAIVLLFLIAAGIAAARQGKLPDKRQTVGLLGAAIIVVLAASYVPEVVAAFLGALIVVMALESADTVSGILDRVLGMIGPPTPGSTFAKLREGL